MSGSRVFIGTRSKGEVRLMEVWSYEDAGRFPWTFLARNLPTVADTGLRKLVKLLSRIPGAKDARGVGREAVEEWLCAPKAFGMRSSSEADLLKILPDLGGDYPIGLVLDADDNMADVFRPGVSATEFVARPEEQAGYLETERYQNVLRIRPRELRATAQMLVDALEGRQAPLPDHTFWEHALLKNEDRSVLEMEPETQLPPSPTVDQLALEAAIALDDFVTLKVLLDESGAHAELELSWRAHSWRPITLAARSGSVRCLELLLDMGVEVGPDEIERAAEAGHAEVVRSILERRPALRPKPRRRFFPGDGDPDQVSFLTPDVENSNPGQPSPA